MGIPFVVYTVLTLIWTFSAINPSTNIAPPSLTKPPPADASPNLPGVLYDSVCIFGIDFDLEYWETK